MTKEFKLISIEATKTMIRDLKTDYAQSKEQAEFFIENNLGLVSKNPQEITLVGILKDSNDYYYAITKDDDMWWLWVTHDLSNEFAGGSENGDLETFSDDYNIPIELLNKMANRWN